MKISFPIILFILSISSISGLRRKWKNHHTSKSSRGMPHWRSSIPNQNETSNDTETRLDDSIQNDENQQNEEPVLKTFDVDSEVLKDFINDLRDIADDLDDIENENKVTKKVKGKSGYKRSDNVGDDDAKEIEGLKHTIDDVVKKMRGIKKRGKDNIIQQITDCVALLLKTFKKLPNDFVKTAMKLKDAIIDLISGVFNNGRKQFRYIADNYEDPYY